VLHNAAQEKSRRRAGCCQSLCGTTGLQRINNHVLCDSTPATQPCARAAGNALPKCNALRVHTEHFVCVRVRMWSGREELEHVYQHVERHPRLRARKSALLPDPSDGTDIVCVLRVGWGAPGLGRHCLGVLMAPNADGPVKFATSADH
jgi:hypothetical protein